VLLPGHDLASVEELAAVIAAPAPRDGGPVRVVRMTCRLRPRSATAVASRRSGSGVERDEHRDEPLPQRIAATLRTGRSSVPGRM
jgi:hypothetical protein